MIQNHIALNRRPSLEINPGEHVETISSVVSGQVSSSDGIRNTSAWLAESWARSLQRYNLDPLKSSRRQVFTAPEIRERSDHAGLLRQVARGHFADLFRQVSVANYCVMLTDAAGMTIDFKAVSEFEATAKKADLRLGTLWTEEEEGTCGVGTAIVSRQPVLVHKGDHFRIDNTPMTCCAAPIFDANDALIGVIDVSCLHSQNNRDSQRLVFEMVVEKAMEIENSYIATTSKDVWGLWLDSRPHSGSPLRQLFIAFGDSGEIVHANRMARQHLLSQFDGRGKIFVDDLIDLDVEHLIESAFTSPGLAIPIRVPKLGQTMYGLARAPEARPSGARRVKSAPGSEARSQPETDALASIALSDPTMLANAALARKVINRRLPILLTGETGSGKEKFAQAIHSSSDRAGKPFVAMNCAAIPESLIESELFGYRDGAFTGARSQGFKGKLLQSDGGTLFLDEIGDMPLTTQSRLLRVLAEGEVLPLGAEQPIKADLNIVCATHRDLVELVRVGSFREDLYYRINGVKIRIPALRERRDVGALIKAIIREESALLGVEPFEICLETLEQLKRHTWPGNIRELRHAVRYACAVCEGYRLDLNCFPDDIIQSGINLPPQLNCSASAVEQKSPTSAPSSDSLSRSADRKGADALARRILDALEESRWNVREACDRLNMPRSTFYRKMSALGLSTGKS